MNKRIFNFNKKTDNLFTAIMKLKTVKEAENFFRDLCTAEELRAISERFEIAGMLNAGFSYREIADDLKVSTTTVARVSFWLENGTGGYKLMLNRANGHHRAPSLAKKGLR